MNQKIRSAILTIISLLLVLPIFQFTTFAQSNDYLYFPETNHSVRGEFLEKYNSVPNPVLVFGYPITEEFVAPRRSPFAGKRVQYFQRAVFEFRTGLAPSQRVQLAPLGTIIISPSHFTPTDPLPQNHPACEIISGSNYKVCYAFLHFFHENGGASIFGVPITDMVKEHNRIIQYFEFARFEWRPELPPGHRVHLTNLGELFFNANEDRSISLSAPQIAAQQIQALQVRAFSLNAVVSNQGFQTIYVSVKDQMNNHLQNANVSLKIVMPNEDAYSLKMPPTNAKGMTEVSFAQKGEPVGIVRIIVEVTYGENYSEITQLTYRIW